MADCGPSIASAVVIDDGSDTCKAGLAGHDAPQAVFPSVVGQPTPDPRPVGSHLKDCYVGDEAVRRKPILELRNPVEPGMRTDWGDQEKIWHHVFYNELRLTPEQHPVLLTEIPQERRVNRERSAVILFEQFNVPAICLAPRPLLSLFAAGCVTGTVLDSGHNKTYAVSAQDGCLLDPSVKVMTFGGLDLTKMLHHRLQGQHSSFSTDLRLVRDVKEKCCFFSSASGCGPETAAKTYQLPDGSEFQCGPEMSQCPNSLFEKHIGETGEQKYKVDDQNVGVHHLVEQSISATDSHLHPCLYGNVYMSGGNTLLTGLKERLTEELSTLTSHTVNISAPLERRYSSWIGGSMLASLPTFASFSISKDEYLEVGAGIVQQKNSLVCYDKLQDGSSNLELVKV